MIFIPMLRAGRDVTLKDIEEIRELTLFFSRLTIFLILCVLGSILIPVIYSILL